MLKNRITKLVMLMIVSMHVHNNTLIASNPIITQYLDEMATGYFGVKDKKRKGQDEDYFANLFMVLRVVMQQRDAICTKSDDFSNLTHELNKIFVETDKKGQQRLINSYKETAQIYNKIIGILKKRKVFDRIMLHYEHLLKKHTCSWQSAQLSKISSKIKEANRCFRILNGQYPRWAQADTKEISAPDKNKIYSAIDSYKISRAQGRFPEKIEIDKDIAMITNLINSQDSTNNITPSDKNSKPKKSVQLSLKKHATALLGKSRNFYSNMEKKMSYQLDSLRRKRKDSQSTPLRIQGN